MSAFPIVARRRHSSPMAALRMIRHTLSFDEDSHEASRTPSSGKGPGLVRDLVREINNSYSSADLAHLTKTLSEEEPEGEGQQDSTSGCAPWLPLRWVRGAYAALNFGDAELEAQFRTHHWELSRPFLAVACLLLSIFTAVRFVFLSLFIMIGKEEYDACCAIFWEVDETKPELHRIVMGFELLGPFICFTLSAGPSSAQTLAAHWLKRYSTFRNHSDEVDVGAVGEAVMIVLSITVGFMATSTFFYGSTFYCQSILQLDSVLLTFPILMQFNIRHMMISCAIAFCSSWTSLVSSAALSPELGEASRAAIAPMLIAWTTVAITSTLVIRREKGLRRRYLAGRMEQKFEHCFHEILMAMLPKRVVSRLTGIAAGTEEVTSQFAEVYNNVSVLFMKVNIQEAGLDAHQTAEELNLLFRKLDHLVASHPHTYKVETVGGEYVAASGCPEPCAAHACALSALAMEAMQIVKHRSWSSRVPIRISMGLHCGSLAAGVAGRAAPRFRLFGDTINTASRMKSQAGVNQCVVSDAVRHEVAQCCGRVGRMDASEIVFCTGGLKLQKMRNRYIKGKGTMQVWLLQETEQFSESHMCVKLRGDAGATGGTRDWRTDSSSTFATLKRKEGIVPLVSGFITNVKALGAFGERTCSDAMMMEKSMAIDYLEEVPDSARLGLRFYPPFWFSDWAMEAAFKRLMYAHDFGFGPTVTLGGMGLMLLGLVVGVVHWMVAVGPRGDQDIPRWSACIAVIWVGFAIAFCAVAALAYLRLGVAQRSTGRMGGTWPVVRFLQSLYTVSCVLALALPFEISGLSIAEESTMWKLLVRNWMLVYRSQVVFALVLLGSSVDIANINIVFITIMFGFTRATTHQAWECDSVMATVLFIILQLVLSVKVQVMHRHFFALNVKAMRVRRSVESLAQELLPDHVLSRTILSPDDNNLLHSDQLMCGHLFADVVGFTAITSRLSPSESFIMISEVFRVFDALCIAWGVSKVETIGDAYWCAVGLKSDATAQDMCRLVGMALEMQSVLDTNIPFLSGLDSKLSIRVGIHYGPCVGCIVGLQMPRYHMFGSTVDVAQLLEQSGSTSGVVLSKAAMERMCGGKAGDAWTAGHFQVSDIGAEGGHADAPVCFAVTVEEHRLSSLRIGELSRLTGSDTAEVVPACILKAFNQQGVSLDGLNPERGVGEGTGEAEPRPCPSRVDPIQWHVPKGSKVSVMMPIEERVKGEPTVVVDPELRIAPRGKAALGNVGRPRPWESVDSLYSAGSGIGVSAEGWPGIGNACGEAGCRSAATHDEGGAAKELDCDGVTLVDKGSWPGGSRCGCMRNDDLKARSLDQLCAHGTSASLSTCCDVGFMGIDQLAHHTGDCAEEPVAPKGSGEGLEESTGK
mmetsp:Transcript_9099/g.22271  ORF Transcript_9099/g.22271 Transcript_9099/m.22271 type:complete len:1374 (-) Transcript_9099:146-4267(-)